MSHDPALSELAGYRDGALAVAASDEFFGPKERLVLDHAPACFPNEYTERGKRVDGWETRRVRTAKAAPDWCVLRLAVPAIPGRVRLDVRGFEWNAPASWWLEGCDCPEEQVLEQPESVEWVLLREAEAVVPNAVTEHEVPAQERVTHLRLWIHPDGGVARLRVQGWPVADMSARADRTGRAELASVPAGGRVVARSDASFAEAGSLGQLVGPATPGEGWETRRRREPGSEWVVLELAAEADVERLEVDTAHFIGNAPKHIGVEVGDDLDGLLAEQPDACRELAHVDIRPHARHWIAGEEPARGRYVRLRLFPDGGLSRVAVHGRITGDGWARAQLTAFNHLGAQRAASLLREWCPSTSWSSRMRDRRPYATVAELVETAEAELGALPDAEIVEAANAHPRIAHIELPDRSRREQAGIHAGAEAPERLADEVVRYETTFGFRYLVDARGRTADELLDDVVARLAGGMATERQRARRELISITGRRIREWFEPPRADVTDEGR